MQQCLGIFEVSRVEAFGEPAVDGYQEVLGFLTWLLLDSRVVDIPMASTPNFVLLSSLQPLFFNGLKNA